MTQTSPYHRGDSGRNTFQSAALTSIFRGVKEYDISKILGKKPNFIFPNIRQPHLSINAEGMDITFNEKKDLSDNLT